MHVKFKNITQLNTVMDVTMKDLLNYILEHNICCVDDMEPVQKDLYYFLKDNRSIELQHVDIIDRRIKKTYNARLKF